MLINVESLARKLGLSGTVLHCGAHLAEEEPLYETLGLSPVYWIEAQSDLVARLIDRLNPKIHTVVHAGVWSESGIELSLLVANNGQSSSLLDFGTHKDQYPDIVEVGREAVLTRTIDDVMRDQNAEVALLNLDIQGAELHALRGAAATLPKVRMVYTEVNFEQVYLGCPLVQEIDHFLASFGFKRVLTARTASGWGDAVYLRPEDLSLTAQSGLLRARLQLWTSYLIDAALRPMVKIRQALVRK